MGDEIKLTTGIISSHSGYQGDKSQYQISAPVQPGNSGGPLFNSKGNIVGIVSAKHTGAENVSYAVKTSYLFDLLNQLPDSHDIVPSANTIADLDLPQQVKQVKNYVCFIWCSSVATAPQPTASAYGKPSVAGKGKVVTFPYVDSGISDIMRILSVTLTETETIVEIECRSVNPEVNYEWIAIDSQTVLETETGQYGLRKAEGIAVPPERTVYTRQGETKVFKLYFPALPPEVTSFSLIEPNGWKFYGISLKE